MKSMLRTVLVLLAAGAVIAAAIALTKPFDPRQDEREILARAVKRPPAPGAEAALRHAITGIQRGHPDYSGMSKDMAEATREELTRNEKLLAGLGPLQSLAYQGGEGSGDLYRANFRAGSLLSDIALGKDGKLDGLDFITPFTPQDWIDNYARFPLPERGKRMAEQFAILLAGAAFGRYALRLRL